MAKPKTQSASARSSSPQEEQRRLLKEASKQPGVAGTIEAYGRLARYGGPIRSDLPSIKYGTGGNLVIRSR
jgi:hypothetical protein